MTEGMNVRYGRRGVAVLLPTRECAEGGVGSRPTDTRLPAGSPGGLWPHTFPRFPADRWRSADSLVRIQDSRCEVDRGRSGQMGAMFWESFGDQTLSLGFTGIAVRV
jgi:hypothetical protein